MTAKKKIAVTGGYSFIGSALTRLLLAETNYEILCGQSRLSPRNQRKSAISFSQG